MLILVELAPRTIHARKLIAAQERCQNEKALLCHDLSTDSGILADSICLSTHPDNYWCTHLWVVRPVAGFIEHQLYTNHNYALFLSIQSYKRDRAPNHDHLVSDIWAFVHRIGRLLSFFASNKFDAGNFFNKIGSYWAKNCCSYQSSFQFDLSSGTWFVGPL